MTKRLLIIDDEERIREVVRACLEDLAGWTALTADSGKAGLSVAATEKLDAILLDISMPDMDGFQFFNELKRQEAAGSIPIILLTAKALTRDGDRLQKLGFAGMVSKPFNPITLCQQIAKIMNWPKEA